MGGGSVSLPTHHGGGMGSAFVFKGGSGEEGEPECVGGGLKVEGAAQVWDLGRQQVRVGVGLQELEGGGCFGVHGGLWGCKEGERAVGASVVGTFGGRRS